MSRNRRTMVVALGGNAVLREGERGTVEEQLANCREGANVLVQLARLDCDIAVVHGNGPEVGNILLRMEMSRHQLPPSTLDVCGAQSQGSLGYLIGQSLQNAFRREGISRPVATILTQTIVDRDDPAFDRPTKPIGPFYKGKDADEMRGQFPGRMVEDAGRGYRRVVASPKPLAFAEMDTIKELVRRGHIVICSGGGGIPVRRLDNGDVAGVEAVIDKDLASAALGNALGADTLLILTAVEKVCVGFKTPNQRELDRLSVDEAKAYLAAGEFPAGSMGPKIRAAINFLEGGGERVIITLPEKAVESLQGDTGTHISRERRSRDFSSALGRGNEDILTRGGLRKTQTILEVS